jgi:putative effector of murein hydrolase LrgA (UPF0299 family)
LVIVKKNACNVKRALDLLFRMIYSGLNKLKKTQTSLNNKFLIVILLLFVTLETVAVLNYSKQLDENCHTSLSTLHISFSISDRRQRKLKFLPE